VGVLMGVLTRQPLAVQTFILLMVRPALLSKVVPPLAPKVPLACKSPVTCRVVSPLAVAPASWPRTVRVLPLATTVSRFRVRVLAAVSAARAWSVCEDSGEEDGEELGCKALLRPKIPVAMTIRLTKPRATA